MTTQLTKSSVGSNLQINSMDDLGRLSSMLARSGYFPDAKAVEQAGVKILAALELGIPVLAGMNNIHLIQGKPTVGANIIAALIKKSIKYNYKVKELTSKICRLEFFEDSQSQGFYEFTEDDAQAAGLLGKDIWKKFRKNMLFSRAISNGGRLYCPDILLGGSLYTPEEFNDDSAIESIPEPKDITPETEKEESSIINFCVSKQAEVAEDSEVLIPPNELHSEFGELFWGLPNAADLWCQISEKYKVKTPEELPDNILKSYIVKIKTSSAGHPDMPMSAAESALIKAKQHAGCVDKGADNV